MKLPLHTGILSRFNPLAHLSDAALYLAGQREHKDNEKPVSLKIAVRSGLLLLPIYIAFSWMLGLLSEPTSFSSYIQKTQWYQYLNAHDLVFLIPLLWAMGGLSLAPLQVWRVRRMNASRLRRRLRALERKAEEETAEIAPSVPLSYSVTDSAANYVTQGIS